MADGTSGVFVLPMLRPGPGDRRPCVHDAGCLERLVRLHPTAPAAHCPPRCASFEPSPPWVAVAHAHAYGVQHPLAACIEGDTEVDERRARHAEAARRAYWARKAEANHG